MPHVVYAKTELDEEYPSLQVPQDDALHDEEAEDQTLEYGLKLAREITAKTAAEGRRRRPSTTVTATKVAPTKDEHNNDDDDHNDHNNHDKPTTKKYEPKKSKRVRFADDQNDQNSLSLNEWRSQHAHQTDGDAERWRSRGFRRRPHEATRDGAGVTVGAELGYGDAAPSRVNVPIDRSMLTQKSARQSQATGIPIER